MFLKISLFHCRWASQASGWPPDHRREPQEEPQRPQHASKSAQESSQTAQEASKSPARRLPKFLVITWTCRLPRPQWTKRADRTYLRGAASINDAAYNAQAHKRWLLFYLLVLRALCERGTLPLTGDQAGDRDQHLGTFHPPTWRSISLRRHRKGKTEHYVPMSGRGTGIQFSNVPTTKTFHGDGGEDS